MRHLRIISATIMVLCSISLTACSLTSEDSKLPEAKAAQKKVTLLAAKLCDSKPKELNKVKSDFVQSMFDYRQAWVSLNSGRSDMMEPAIVEETSTRICERAKQVIKAQPAPAKKKG